MPSPMPQTGSLHLRTRDMRPSWRTSSRSWPRATTRKKKHLLRRLVKKVLVHDRRTSRSGTGYRTLGGSKTVTEGSGGGTRTPDPTVNSRLLYQLSYSGRRRGSVMSRFAPRKELVRISNRRSHCPVAATGSVSRCTARASRRNLPVCVSVSATSSGVPVATNRPPSAPPSGPKSRIQSARLITSK